MWFVKTLVAMTTAEQNGFGQEMQVTMPVDTLAPATISQNSVVVHYGTTIFYASHDQVTFLFGAAAQEAAILLGYGHTLHDQAEVDEEQEDREDQRVADADYYFGQDHQD